MAVVPCGSGGGSRDIRKELLEMFLAMGLLVVVGDRQM
jgi:hypothetical protein